MDEDLKEAIATGVTAALQKAAGGKGLKDAELLEKVDECESAAQLRIVLGQMKRAGQVTQNTTTGRWALTIAGVAGQAPAKLETSPPPAPADKQPKRHPCAVAILEALAGAPQLRLGELEEHALLKGKWKLTTIGYHVKCLVKAGDVKPGENRLAGFSLATGAPIAPRVAATDKASRKKKAARQAPKTARLTAAAERKAAGDSGRPFLTAFPESRVRAEFRASEGLQAGFRCEDYYVSFMRGQFAHHLFRNLPDEPAGADIPQWRAQYDSDPTLRADFPKFKHYVAYARAYRTGRVQEPLPKSTPTEDLSVTMRCPNGNLTISGSRVLVFGFLDQLKALAA